jgi:hypothetical protein
MKTAAVESSITLFRTLEQVLQEYVCMMLLNGLSHPVIDTNKLAGRIDSMLRFLPVVIRKSPR